MKNGSEISDVDKNSEVSYESRFSSEFTMASDKLCSLSFFISAVTSLQKKLKPMLLKIRKLPKT